MRIAFVGSRGIPRCYSGFETAVEEVSIRLVRMGHGVTVYNRVPFNTYAADDFHGVRIIRMPTLPFKGTDTLAHSAFCTAHVLGLRPDVVYFCGVGSSIFSAPLRLAGMKTIVNVDGADWQRAKWGLLGKTWLRWSEGMAARFADSVIADHPVIKERYSRQFGIECDLVSYGADVVENDPGRAALEKLGIQPGEYYLYVSRLTPENAADVVMEAYLRSGAKRPLIVVGDAPYVTDYVEKIRRLAASSEGRIRMTGYLFGDAYKQLSFHSRAYIFPTSIEATRPVLLEQMGMGACVLARDTASNRHILADAALWFDDADPVPSLATRFAEVDQPSHSAAERSATARRRIREHYNWDHVATQYDRLLHRLVSRRE